MAFKKVESSSSKSLPFFDDWVKEQSDEYKDFLVDKLVEPKTIKAVESGKGFLLNFDDAFMVFLWKNSSIGKVIKSMIRDEQGNLILLQFEKTKKGLSYQIGFDDEVEVALTEDKYDEGIYYSEATTETPSIAPSENRTMLTDLPLMVAKPPVKFTATPKAINKHKQRSDGAGDK